jgi:hypothetical protein
VGAFKSLLGHKWKELVNRINVLTKEAVVSHSHYSLGEGRERSSVEALTK